MYIYLYLVTEQLLLTVTWDTNDVMWFEHTVSVWKEQFSWMVWLEALRLKWLTTKPSINLWRRVRRTPTKMTSLFTSRPTWWCMLSQKVVCICFNIHQYYSRILVWELELICLKHNLNDLISTIIFKTSVQLHGQFNETRNFLSMKFVCYIYASLCWFIKLNVWNRML